MEELYGSFMKREEIGELLSHVLDLERLVTKIVYGTANAKDLRAVSSTAAVLPELRRLLEESTSEELSRIWRELDTRMKMDVNIVRPAEIVVHTAYTKTA